VSPSSTVTDASQARCRATGPVYDNRAPIGERAVRNKTGRGAYGVSGCGGAGTAAPLERVYSPVQAGVCTPEEEGSSLAPGHGAWELFGVGHDLPFRTLTEPSSMEAILRRGLATTGIILLICFSFHAPAAAQARGGWSVQLEGNAGFFKSTRDIGKILGTEVEATIQTVLQPAPMYSMGVVLSGPSPNYSLRATVGYMSTEARGQAIECSILSGAGCTPFDVSTTALLGFFDVLLHNDVTGTGTLKYFVAGAGMRSYAFDEVGCRGPDLDPVLFNVCTPMEEFLADQVNLVFRLGVGIRGRGGPIGWNVEVTDLVGRFTGSGARGEGGTQNDFVLSAGLSFPGQ